MTIPDRIYAQYRTKPKAVAWLNIARQMSGDLIAACTAIRNSYDIDSATGEQLNVIGRIVVLSRDFIGQVAMIPAMFAEPDGGEFGDTEAAFSELYVDSDNQMSDNLYRLAIKAKILKNNSDATIESILQGMNFLLPNAQVLRVQDNENMTFSIEFFGEISQIERWALLNAGLVPKPQGVRFSGFLEGFNYVEFGDTEMEFGDTNAEFVGFIGA